MNTITATPARFACDLDDADDLDRHVLCATRTACAFSPAADLDPATHLADFYPTPGTAADRAARRWLLDYETANPQATPAQVEAAHAEHLAAAARSARDRAEARARNERSRAEAETCPVCQRPGTILVEGQRPTAATDDTAAGPKVRFVGYDTKGAPVLAADAAAHAHRAPRPYWKTTTYHPGPGQRVDLPHPTGRRVSVIACACCRPVLVEEAVGVLAAMRTPAGQTLAAACASKVADLFAETVNGAGR